MGRRKKLEKIKRGDGGAPRLRPLGDLIPRGKKKNRMHNPPGQTPPPPHTFQAKAATKESDCVRVSKEKISF